MRVLMLGEHRRDPLAGAASIVINTADALRALGHHVEELFYDELAPFDNRFAIDAIPLAVPLKLTRRLEEFDVIDAEFFVGWALFTALRRRRRRPLFITRTSGLHQEVHRETMEEAALGREQVSLRYRLRGGAVHLAAERRAIRAADGFVSLTRADAERVIEWGWKQADQILVSECGIAAEAFAVARDPAKEWSGRVGWCATMISRKGWDYFVKGFSAVARDLDLRLDLLGTHAEPEEARSHFPVDLRERVTVHATRPRRESFEVLAGADVFVSASLNEGFHLALQEAMALGVPCVATREGFLLDELRPEELAVVVDKRSGDAIADALRRLAGDSELRSSLSVRGREFARSLSWDDVGREYAAWLEEQLARFRGIESGQRRSEHTGLRSVRAARLREVEG
jgi:glycosyltransferase involved in cell wall biosynthesis